MIRRLDEYASNGDRIETYFDESQGNAPTITRFMHRMNSVVPDDLSFDLAVGDDSHLIREGNSVMDVARPIATEFEEDPSLTIVTKAVMPLAA